MKIQNLKSPNFCARAEYHSWFQNRLQLDEWNQEPQLSVDARNAIAEVEDLPEGYYYEVLRDGCDNRMHAKASTNFLDVLSIGIKHDNGDTFLPHKEIFHRREFETPSWMEYSSSDRQEFHNGELEDPNDLTGSLKKLVHNMRKEFEIKLIDRGLKKALKQGLDDTEGPGLLDALTRLAKLLGCKIVRNV